MSTVDRVPAWKVRRMTAAQRQAFDRLRWHDPPPAERARLKRTLGMRRTREETLALLRELLDKRMVRAAILDELGCTDRHLRRLLAEVQKVEKPARKPVSQLEQTDITDRTRVVTHPSDRATYGGDLFAYDFAAALRRSRP